MTGPVSHKMHLTAKITRDTKVTMIKISLDTVHHCSALLGI